MGENSKIEWTDNTFNPVRGCEKESPGCDNCYALALSKRNPATLVSNPCRMGPLTLQARRWGLSIVKDIQRRASVDLINAEEEAKILELIDAQTWPRGWDGTEPLASVSFDNVNPDGSVQPVMHALMEGSPSA